MITRRIKKFEEMKRICKEKLGSEQLEKQESFLSQLKKIECTYPDLRGACEVLYDFYKGKSSVDENDIDAALEEIKNK